MGQVVTLIGVLGLLIIVGFFAKLGWDHLTDAPWVVEYRRYLKKRRERAKGLRRL